MIFDQFFAYLSAISLLESTGKKKKTGTSACYSTKEEQTLWSKPRGRGGGNSHMKGAGMLVCLTFKRHFIPNISRQNQLQRLFCFFVAEIR